MLYVGVMSQTSGLCILRFSRSLPFFFFNVRRPQHVVDIDAL